MNFKKLFARPVTKRAIYKKLCQFIDNNYVAYSPEAEEKAKPKVYKPTHKQAPVSTAKPIPQPPASPVKEQTKPVVNAQELSSSEERQTPIVRYSPRRTTSESTSDPFKKYVPDTDARFSLNTDDEDSRPRFSLSTDDEDTAPRFSLEPTKDDGAKFSRETNHSAGNVRYSVGSSDFFRELPKTPKPKQSSCDYYRAPVEKRTEPPKTKTEALAQIVSATEKKDKFTACMLRFMSRKGLSDATVYNRVFMDRKLFNKIRNNPDYQPNKRTALLIALALKLTYKETQDLLETAGYTLSRSNKRDVIIEFYIRESNYDIFEINEMLEHFKQPLLMKCD